MPCDNILWKISQKKNMRQEILTLMSAEKCARDRTQVPVCVCVILTARAQILVRAT